MLFKLESLLKQNKINTHLVYTKHKIHVYDYPISTGKNEAKLLFPKMEKRHEMKNEH